MRGNFNICMKLLEDNEESVKREARNIILKLCNNILKYPTNARFRRVRLSNPIVMSKLLPASGAIECLFESGFIEDDDGFSLPEDAPLSLLEDLKRLLDRPQPETLPQKSISQCEKPPTSKQISQKPPQGRPNFFTEIARHFQDVLRYEDQKLQERARLLVPLTKLELGAMERMRCIQRSVKTKNAENKCDNRTSTEEGLTIEDLLLAELLRWFKYEFFKWVNSPECNVCSNACAFVRVESSQDPRVSRVEVHRCSNCGNEVNFSRYTDPGPLLSTRQGRCGEWANVFTLICRSLGYDARLVVDKTDHVWTEIWSVTEKRWIHADPCENTMDRPLMYEKGWGKKLSYVIAFSKDEIQDVTWRYTRDPESVKKRRNLSSEENLAVLISKLNDQRQSSMNYSSNRKDYVVKRRLLELVDMLPAPPGSKKPKEDEDDNYKGRTSGSLLWRLARGETQAKPLEPRKWLIPSGVREYELQYFVVEDIYEARVENKGSILETRSGWQNGLEASEGGIFRKEESDWKMVYLARSPGTKSGFLSWTFELSDSKLAFDSLKLSLTIGTFHEGNVRWKIQKFYYEKESEIEVISDEDCRNFQTSLKGAVRISLKAILSGGEGELAWQHAQLFRQSLNSKNEHSMIIKISLEKR